MKLKKRRQVKLHVSKNNKETLKFKVQYIISTVTQ